MATRRHDLLARNRKNMGIFEEAESQTAAFNDPQIQRMKMLTQMGDTSKELVSGWKNLQDAAWKYRKKRGDLDPPPRPDVGYNIETEEEDLAEDMTLEDLNELDPMSWNAPGGYTHIDASQIPGAESKDFVPWELSPGQIEYNRKTSGGIDPHKPVYGPTKGGQTNFASNVTPESVNNYVHYVMDDKTKTNNFSDRKEHSSPGWFGEGSWFSDSIGYLRKGGLSHKAREAGYPNVNAYLKAVREGEIE